ncbi:hypothetical protein NC652_034160 [Populus alba x Populus x berolinensis]|nr:hypothetical protein NC652_034160 [Populus alba x Populus x berolinensis]
MEMQCQLQTWDLVGYFSLAKPDAGKLIIATLALLIASTSNILIPKFGGKIIDIVSGDTETPEQKAEGLRAVNSTILEIFLVVIVVKGLLLRLRKNLFNHLINQEIAFFDVTRTGELLSRLSEDTQIIKNAATSNLSEALRNVSTAFIGLGFMLATSWKLTLLALVVVPPISVAVSQFGRFLRENSHKTQAAAAASASIAEWHLHLNLSALERTVRSFAQEGYESSRYSEKVDETLKLGLKQAIQKLVGLFFGGLNAASTLSVIIVVIYGANLTSTGSMTTGALTSFILYSLTVGGSISGLSGLYTIAMKAAGASRRVFQLLDRVSYMPKSGNKCPLSEQVGDVELDDVWFAYPSRPNDMVLQGITLKLQPGSKVALVGPSGGGKVPFLSFFSILLRNKLSSYTLSLRFYDPIKGKVLLNGVPLVEISHEHLHSKISIVSQEPVLFNCSIEQNIAYGCEGKVSSMDIENAADAMDSLMKGRTVLVIAHRLSNCSKCGHCGSCF